MHRAPPRCCPPATSSRVTLRKPPINFCAHSRAWMVLWGGHDGGTHVAMPALPVAAPFHAVHNVGEMQVGTLDTPIEVEAIALVAMHIPFVVTYIESPIRTTPLKTEEHQAFGMQCSHARRGEQDVPFGGS